MSIELIAAHCRCCSQPSALLPRVDLAPDLAVCPRSGQLHRAQGSAYVVTDNLPARHLPPTIHTPPVQIDLSKEGYA